ncbi:MAG: isoprenylcysteine carboxylmethyltransferase family protein [Gemmatimonadetes bacterium]|nr:isoprenylcysteine carboxylmethyltransferase family protein [Gemmatimonadota bacterium]NIQ58134.1 isoprenylcysteine carboxylmethyltransferase family protein [Gemmatimonadota bacterium]NIU78338.1 isoprenylcysteine carboxylmethyltransferase family protein [Gammaproteobacteria bacterium]NIX47285.1 isoprenylcysteine carboxylmethyltransferase family protein [Gemmatimonadota bacterium]NIY11662.1 isoprenylcysteine carboxylmethyltransferase family protein [Gemmatimonadota bacterium]
MLRIAVFILATIPLAWVSRRSLRSPRHHGFHRFLAWEAIVGLILINFRGPAAWFADPLAPLEIASWILLFASIGVLVPGVRALLAPGRAEVDGDRAELLPFERTTELVTTGVYRYIRHPMYASLLYLAWGVFLKRPGWPGVVLALTATGFLYAAAKAEEAENLRYFGERYRMYMGGARMFVPFVW